MEDEYFIIVISLKSQIHFFSLLIGGCVLCPTNERLRAVRAAPGRPLRVRGPHGRDVSLDKGDQLLKNFKKAYLYNSTVHCIVETCKAVAVCFEGFRCLFSFSIITKVF